jgi:hypothetical protein
MVDGKSGIGSVGRRGFGVDVWLRLEAVRVVSFSPTTKLQYLTRFTHNAIRTLDQA